MSAEFKKVKDNSRRSFKSLEIFVNSVTKILTLYEKNPFLKSSYKEEFRREIGDIQNDLAPYLEKIGREKMKLVFIGQTSSGKSAVINAILGQKILPSSDGRTTSCFITIDGCDEPRGYFMIDNRRASGGPETLAPNEASFIDEVESFSQNYEDGIIRCFANGISLQENQRESINRLYQSIKLNMTRLCMHRIFHLMERFRPYIKKNIAAMRISEVVLYQFCEITKRFQKPHLASNVKVKLLNICMEYWKINNTSQEIKLASAVVICQTIGGANDVHNFTEIKEYVTKERRNECSTGHYGFSEKELDEAVEIDEYDLNNLVTVASEIYKGGTSINSHIELFFPTKICKLLQHNVQLLDTPGVDYSRENDKWIETYCVDSDVFVYVVNGTTTIMESERVIFRKVTAFIKEPNIFVVMNKWDLCDTEENKENIDEVKNHHYSAIKKFLCDDLKIRCDPREKTFFLSAKEQLEGSGTGTNDRKKQQMKEDFDRFYQTLCREMTERAIINKFRLHILKGAEYLERIMSILNKLEMCKKNQEYAEPRDEGHLRREINKYIEDMFKRIIEIGGDIINDQSLQFALSIMNDKKNESIYCLKTTEFMKAKIIKSLREILEENVKKLGIQIKCAFTEYSQFRIIDDALRDFVPTTFTKYIDNLERSLSSTFQEVDSTLQDRYISKEVEMNKPGVRGYTARLGQLVGLASLSLMIPFPAAAVVAIGITGVVNVVAQMFPAVDKSKETMEYVKNGTATLLMNGMTDCYKKCQKDIEGDVHELINTFVRDHCEARTIMAEIDDGLRNKYHNILQDLLEDATPG